MKEYLKELPTVSVIIIFYNEHWSALLRTVYSVLNRSPPALLKEIILVNDHSTKPFLWTPLREFVESELAPKVRLVDLPERSGLIVARMAGAREARGDVLIVLDSHTEVNTNWLPPLLGKFPIQSSYMLSSTDMKYLLLFRTNCRGLQDVRLSLHRCDRTRHIPVPLTRRR